MSDHLKEKKAMSDDRHESISRRAYEIWEKEGGSHGRDSDHWHQAAGEVDQGGTQVAPDGTTIGEGSSITDAETTSPATHEAPAGATDEAEPADSPAVATPRPKAPPKRKASAEPADTPAPAAPKSRKTKTK
ncbi:DUF2934 domain-containing protein [Sphingomonas sp. Leaf339]|uniref:DUF2934 domain-containing protein n=1 Tax=Sphingomonas sp. Leaf339 TaxID=1736343 RepID=UPI0019100931|nr:DUF2934 domain-containing protein [Sphingomonas sp. Leaf339]